MDNDERKFYALIERAVVALEKLAGIEAPVESPKSPMTETQRRDLVTLVRRKRNEPTAEWDGSSLPPGGGDVDPATFWSRPDPEAARMKRPTRSERA